MKVYGAGVKEVNIIYRPGKDNANAYALSRNPVMTADLQSEEDIQVAVVKGNETIEELLQAELDNETTRSDEFWNEQRKDPQVLKMFQYIENETLPEEEKEAKRIVLQSNLFTVTNDVLYFIDSRQNYRKRAVVPNHLRQQIMKENHCSQMAGHFSGNRLYRTLARSWWWSGMYHDTIKFAESCPQCAIATGSSRSNKPPLHPIPVDRIFQIFGVDVMDLPKTDRGNQHVVVFQDFLSKWPFVFPVPDQKAITLVKLFVEEVVPVPEALLSDRGTNLLSHLMQDVCKLLGTTKLNTTAYHPQCDGMVERFNRTLKMMLRKHAAEFGSQWDTSLPGVLWAYRNTPHESTGEKPSFLLFGIDCRSPTESAFLPVNKIKEVDISDYQKEFVMSISSARNLAAKSIQSAQQKYKKNYDKNAHQVNFRIEDWVLVHFPQDETGSGRKLSRPWHGPYRIVKCDDPNLTVLKVYFPEHGAIQIHQTSVKPCPMGFPAGYYWYGQRKHGPG